MSFLRAKKRKATTQAVAELEESNKKFKTAISTFWDTSTNKQLMDQMTKHLIDQMIRQKDAVIGRHFTATAQDDFAEVKRCTEIHDDPKFAEAIDWYLENKDEQDDL